MSTDNQLPPCDVCGKPATKSTRDITDDGDDGRYRKFKAGSWRHGCDKHPPLPSRELNKNGDVVGPDFIMPIPHTGGLK